MVTMQALRDTERFVLEKQHPILNEVVPFTPKPEEKPEPEPEKEAA